MHCYNITTVHLELWATNFQPSVLAISYLDDILIYVCAIANFDVTDEEITLKGFIGLHEMAAADEEGGEEELRQVISGMGYDKQLRLSQVCILDSLV